MTIVCLLLLLSFIALVSTKKFHPHIHPIINSLSEKNGRKQNVRFGSHLVENEDLFDEKGNSLLHHHHRRLGSLIHETLRSRLVYLPSLCPLSVDGEIIEFELFDGVVVIAKTNLLMVHDEDSVGWTGDVRISTENLEEDLKVSDGYFGLSCYKKSCVAHIQIYSTNQEFHLSPSGIPLDGEGDGIYSISETKLDPNRRTGVTPAHVIHGDHSRNHVVGSLRGPKVTNIVSQVVVDDHIIDILVIYTPEAVINHAGGSEAAMKAMINLANDQANEILYNSAMQFRYRIVASYSAGADFLEPTDNNAFETLLEWLTTPNDGYLDEVQTWREFHGADEVLLVNAANSYCGLAWVNLGFSSDFAYANYNGGCLSGVVWGHEIGHNFGCFHDRFSDPTTSANYANYLGFGSCWEDASKNDCTCYASVMTYQCDTVPNHCTSCTGKDYYANYLVTESGSPTGQTNASCGLWMTQNHDTVTNYLPTTQPGGIIFSVFPNLVVGDSCSIVNISGWQISTSGNDITVVTLNGFSALILNQTMNYVLVLSPIITQSSGLTTGDVVVTTSSGRVTTLSKGFTFVSSTFTDFEDWKSRVLPTGIWQDNGTIPWSFATENGQSVLFNDGNTGNSQNGYVRLLWQSSNKFDASQGGCKAIATSINFAYKAYSDFVSCYDKFSLSVQQNYISQWTTIWNGQTLSSTASNPWIYASITLPKKTTAITIFANTNSAQNCRGWAPVKIANLTTELVSTCDISKACSRLLIPTAIPTNSPTYQPSSSLSPTQSPTNTASPSAVPTFAPTGTFAPSATSGIINFANPKEVVGTSCFSVVISGSQLGTGSDITAVTLAGVSAQIVNQTADTVTVLTPIVSNAMNIAGDIQVFAAGNRVSTLVKGFTFRTPTYDDFQDFSSGQLPAGIWTDAGTIPWSFITDGTNIRLFKDGGLGDSENYFVNLLWTGGRGLTAGEGGCVYTPTTVSFTYWAYSEYPFCYNIFSLSVQTSYSSTWRTVWNGITNSTSPTSWFNASIILPARTTAMSLMIDTEVIDYCRWWAPVKIDNLRTTMISSCKQQFCPTKSPTVRPSRAPSRPPSQAPSRAPSPSPTVVPTRLPTFPPSFNPSATPTFRPTRLPTPIPTFTPTRTPTSASPNFSSTQTPTRRPSIAPTLQQTTSPTILPTLTLSTLPTAAPTIQSTASPTASPTFIPTQHPSTSPTLQQTSSPTIVPTLAPSNLPTATPTIQSTASPTASPTFTPTRRPSIAPTLQQTSSPTRVPTLAPSNLPTATPTIQSTSSPTATRSPTRMPTRSPTRQQTSFPTTSPTFASTRTPTRRPSAIPTKSLTSAPTPAPTFTPTRKPTIAPTRTIVSISPSRKPTTSAPK